MKKIASVIACLSILVSGCATVITGTDQNLTFKTEPEGATVTISGKVLGLTPLTSVVSKGKNQALTFEKEGYKTFTTQLSTSTEGWFFGNIFGGLLGLFSSTTDGVSGAMVQFSQDQYYVTLVPDNKGGLKSGTAGKIKEYVIAYGDQIKAELVQQKGEILDGLLELIGSESDNQITLKMLSNLSTNSENDLDFAEQIINVYGL